MLLGKFSQVGSTQYVQVCFFWIFSRITALQSTMTLSTFLLVLVLHPEIQNKAQAEIDQMLKGALPTFEDQESLPYVTAVFKEALRWKPVFPFG